MQTAGSIVMAFKKLTTVVLCLLLTVVHAAAQDTSFTTTVIPVSPDKGVVTPATLPDANKQAPTQEQPSKTKKALSQAAVVAAIIATSIAYYKSSSGGPCACPEDRARNGSRCGKRSAHSKSGGYDVTCYPSDVTPEMISAWRAENEK